MRLARTVRVATRFVLMFPLAALSAAAVPAAAHAPDCTLPDFDYNAACGPEFEVPAWGDGGGWTDPSKYTTIQLADLTGSGADESFARNDDGEPAPRASVTVEALNDTGLGTFTRERS